MNDTIDRLFKCLNDLDYEVLAGLVSDDARFEVPYAEMVAQGRDAFVRVFSENTAHLFRDMVFTVDQVYSCESEAVIVEYRSRAVLRATDKPYKNRYVGVFVVRDGAVELWREYFNPLELIVAQTAE
jgi:ketosteroid isomerase-like protein